MYVNLTDVFTSEGKVVQKSIPIEMEEFSCKNGKYEIVGKTPVSFTFSNLGIGKVRVQGEADVTLRMNCDRCLKPVDEVLHLDFEQEVFSPEVARPDSTDDDQPYMEDYQLNVEELVNTEITVNLPMKVLCKADCKGICRQRGKDLNTGSCECDAFVPDPRMAAIKDIFYGNKEV